MILKNTLQNKSTYFEAPLPIARATVIAVAKKGFEIFYAEKQISIGVDKKILLEFEKIELKALQNRLTHLDNSF